MNYHSLLSLIIIIVIYLEVSVDHHEGDDHLRVRRVLLVLQLAETLKLQT